MYLFPVEGRKSSIEGMGVFALAPIKKGQVVWKYVETHDRSLSQEEYVALDANGKALMQKVAYLSTVSQRWIYPPENDPARYTNHSATKNNLSVVLDPRVSEEPHFVAKRDIAVGEELLNNYLEFDRFTQESKPAWIENI